MSGGDDDEDDDDDDECPRVSGVDNPRVVMMIDMYIFEFWAIQLRITGPKEMQSPERLYKYAIYNGEQVHFSI